MSDEAALRDVLWKMYQEHCTQGRHHETQRSTVAGALIAISGAVIGLVTFDRGITTIDAPLALFVFLLGAFGAIFSAKHYERFQLHMTRARVYRDALDDLLPGSPLGKLKKAADKEHGEKNKGLSELRLNRFWLMLYLLIAAIGLVLTVMALVWQIPPPPSA